MLGVVSLTVIVLAFVVIAFSLPFWLKSMRLYGRRGDFRCTLCGNCCRFRFTSLTQGDVKRLEDAGYRDFTSGGGKLSLRRVNGRCVFLGDDKCTVYECRPQVCREFPFFRVYGVGYAEQTSCCPALEELENG